MKVLHGLVCLFWAFATVEAYSQSSNFFTPEGQVNYRFNSSDCPRIMERFARNEARNTSFEDIVSNELCKQVPGALGIQSQLSYKIELQDNDILASWASDADVEWQAQGLGTFREVSKCRTISLPRAETKLYATLDGSTRLSQTLDFLFEPFTAKVDIGARFNGHVRVNEKLRTNYFGNCADPTTGDDYSLVANATTKANVQLLGNLGLHVEYLGRGLFQATTNPYLIAVPEIKEFEFTFDATGRNHGIFAFHQYFNTIGSFINLAFRGFGDKISGVHRGRTHDAFIDGLISWVETFGGLYERLSTLNGGEGYQPIVDTISDSIHGEIVKNYLDLNPYAKRINDEFAAQIAQKVPRSKTFYVIPYLRSKLDPILVKNGIPPHIITDVHLEQALDFLIRKGSLDDFVKYTAQVYWETDIKPKFLGMHGREPTDSEKARILSKIASAPLLQILAEANQIIVDIPTTIELPSGSPLTIPLPTRDADGDAVSYVIGTTRYNPVSYQEFLALYAHLPPCEPNDTVCEDSRLPDCGVYIEAPKCVQRHWFVPRYQTNNAIYGSVQIDALNSRLIYTPSSVPSTTYDAFTLKVSQTSNTTNYQDIKIVLQFAANPALISNLFQVYMGRPATEEETHDAIDKMNGGISSYDLENYIRGQVSDLASRNSANTQAWASLYAKASAKHASLLNAPTLQWKSNLFVFSLEGMDLEKPFLPLVPDGSVPAAKLTARKIARLNALVDAVSLPEVCEVDSHWRIEARVRYAEAIATTDCQAQAQYRECSHGSYTPWSGSYTFEKCELASNDTDKDGVANAADLCPGEDDNFRSADGLCPIQHLARENGINSTRWSSLSNRAFAVDGSFNGAYTLDWAEARTTFLNAGLDFYNRALVLTPATSIPEAMAKRAEIEVYEARLVPFELCAFQPGGCQPPASCGSTPSGTSITRIKFLSASDPVSCQSEVQSSTCTNGSFSAWTGTYTYDSCQVPAPCGPTPSGTSITRTKYQSATDPVSCQSEVQSSTCTNGSFSAWTGTYSYDTCQLVSTDSDSDGDGVPNSTDKCPGENDAGIATKWVDADNDGYWVKKFEQCPSAPGLVTPPTLLKANGEPYAVDDNDTAVKTNYTYLVMTVADSSTYDFDLDGILNESHSVYLIANGHQWLDFAKKCSDSTLVYTSCSAKVRLAADIDFSTVTLNETGHLKSAAACDMNFDGDTVDAQDKKCLEISSKKYLLGAPEHQEWFTGVIDGGGRSFKNLRVNMPNSDEIGALSRSTWGATIRNINLEQVSVLGKNIVGGVTGWFDGGTISQVTSTGYVKGIATVGGLIGEINASDPYGYPLRKVSALLNASIVESTCNGLCAVGGIFGVAGGSYTAITMSQLANHGEVIANNSTWVGGIVGMMSKQSSITDSYNIANINGYTVVGGIAGLELSDAKGLSRVYSSGKIKAINSSGFIVGEHQSTRAVSGYWKNTALITGGNDGVGVGSNSSTSSLTETQLKTLATFVGAGWSIGSPSSTSTIWYIEEGSSYPALNSLKSSYKACNAGADVPGKCSP